MTGPPIDNAITNTVLPPQSQGNPVADSIPTLAAAPQLIMTPGPVRPNYIFADGGGVSGVIGNIYTGYGQGLGETGIVVNDGGNDDQFQSGATDDLNFWQYFTFDNIWRKVTYITGNLMKLNSTDNAPLDGELAVYDFDNDEWIPQKSDEPISGIIEVPVNKIYTLVPSGFAYDIEIVSTFSSLEAGTANVVFQSGVITIGNAITLDVSSVSAGASFLNFQIDYKRRLAP